MDEGGEGEGGLKDDPRLSDLSHFRVSSAKRGSAGRSKAGADSVSGDAEFEVPVKHLSRDGPADSCIYGPGAQERSLG